MNLQHLRSVREVVRQGFHLTLAARQLNASQPGITRHVQLVEQELGLELFVRSRKRYQGLSAAGQTLLPVISRTLNAIDDLHLAARELRSGEVATLTVATVHTHARYSLPPAIERFVRDFPKVQLRLRHGNRAQAAKWVEEGEADFLVSTMPSEPFPHLEFFPCYEIHRTILTRPGHPLLRHKQPKLENIALYPIITYDHEYAARADIARAFQEKRLQINVVLSATDADIMKTYVASGLGIGIVAHVAYDQSRDTGLCAIDARGLFKSNTVHVGVRRDGHLSKHALYLIGLFAPKVADALEKSVARDGAKAVLVHR